MTNIEKEMLAAIRALPILPERQEHAEQCARLLAMVAQEGTIVTLPRYYRCKGLSEAREKVIAFERVCRQLSKIIGDLPAEAFQLLNGWGADPALTEAFQLLTGVGVAKEGEPSFRYRVSPVLCAPGEEAEFPRSGFLFRLWDDLDDSAAAARDVQQTLDVQGLPLVVAWPRTTRANANVRAKYLTYACRRVFKHLTGLRPARRTNPDSGEVYGPFFEFVGRVLHAAGIKASAEWYVRSAPSRSKEQRGGWKSA